MEPIESGKDGGLSRSFLVFLGDRDVARAGANVLPYTPVGRRGLPCISPAREVCFGVWRGAPKVL